MSEHDEQKYLFQEWMPLMQAQYPELKLAFAIPNGGLRPYKKINTGAGIPRRLIS